MDPEQFGWLTMLSNASKLDDKELRRHASVSTDNRHACVSCFTCACEVVRKQRRAAALVNAEAARRLHAGGA
jgi:hypothetical protein